MIVQLAPQFFAGRLGYTIDEAVYWDPFTALPSKIIHLKDPSEWFPSRRA